MATPLLLRLTAEAGEIWKHCIAPHLDAADTLVLRGTSSGLRREVERKPWAVVRSYGYYKCPLETDIIRAVVLSAARLRWAREHGCPCDE